MLQPIVLSAKSVLYFIASLCYLFPLIVKGDFYFSEKETVFDTIKFTLLLFITIFIVVRDTKNCKKKEEMEKLISEIGK